MAEADYQLGLSKIFFRPGKGAFLEELKERDLSEVIPLLTAKIKEWEVRKAAKLKVALATQRYFHRREFLRMRSAARLSASGWCCTRGSNSAAYLLCAKAPRGGRPSSSATCTARPPRDAACTSALPPKSSARLTPRDQASMAWPKGWP